MFTFSAGTKRQNFRGLTRLQQPNRKSRAGWFMRASVYLFSGCRGEWDNVTCWQSAAVGEVTTLPCPSPLLHLFGKHGEFFFFPRCEFRKFRSSTTNQRRREVPTEEDAEEVEGRGRWSKGEMKTWWMAMMKMRAAVRKETPAEVTAANHSSPSQSQDLQPQLLFSAVNHLSSDSLMNLCLFLSFTFLSKFPHLPLVHQRKFSSVFQLHFKTLLNISELNSACLWQVSWAGTARRRAGLASTPPSSTPAGQTTSTNPQRWVHHLC